jgi:hypothetical protein
VIRRVPLELDGEADFYGQEAAVPMPRFRIAWLMISVAIAGFNCWAIRMIIWDYGGPIADRVGIGALPMANILIVAPLVGYPYRGSRRFLWGFEVFGAMAVTLYVALTIRFPAGVPVLTPYLRLAVDPLIGAWRAPWTSPRLMIGYVLVSLWVSLPQLAFALIGGFLTHHLRMH